jgi:hypothetical protein
MLTHPLCFVSKSQYKLWREALMSGNEIANICTDCTPSYKAQMVKQSRCHKPKTVFAIDADGFIEGFSDGKQHRFTTRQLIAA